MNQEEKWLKWAMEIQAIAQNGLWYGKDEFDKERYTSISKTISRYLHYSTDGVLNLYKLFVEEIIERYSSDNAYIDLLIPRGSASLIRYVREHATVPVIETGAGVCHTYFDRAGNTDKGAAVIFNAKTRRVSVCNALDCLLVHRERLADLPSLCRPLADKRVMIYADADSFRRVDSPLHR